VAEWSACLAKRVRFLVPVTFFLFLSFFIGGLVTEERLRTPASNVFSVAEWLALLRYQWLCLDSVRGSWFKPAIKCRAQPRKIAEIRESGRMGKTSPVIEPLRRHLPGLRCDGFASGGTPSNPPSSKIVGSQGGA